MNDAPAEIKARLAIEDLVGQYVQLKKTGRSFKGLCPFHAEKTPSFVVSPERGIAYCFGCHKGGDIFKFMQEIEGIDFVEALKLLAERTGVELKNYKVEHSIPTSEKEQLFQIHEVATKFYQHALWETPDGEKVLDYLHQRGLNDETIKLFQVGFAPDSYEATYSLLLQEGFTKKAVVASGLALSQETTFDKIYDRFRGRLMFPITNSLGRIVAFGGRALKKDQEPKYLNSPETPIYHKSHTLYAFSFAKPALKKEASVLMVEGYMDALAAYQAGIQNVVATSGTALTLQQLRLVQPFVQTLLLAFDMDNAGQEAAKRAYDLTLDFDFQVKMVQLPEGKDIAEFAQQHAQDLPQILQQAQSYGEYFYERLLKMYGTDDIVAKRKILQEFYGFFTMLRSSVEKDFFVRKLASDLHLTEVQVYDEMKRHKLPQYHPARSHQSLDQPAENLKMKKYTRTDLFLGFMIEFPRMAQLFKNRLSEEFFEDELKPIYNAFFDYYNGQGLEEPTGNFLGSLEQVVGQDLAQTAGLLSLYIAEHYGEMGEEAVEKEMGVLVDNILKNHSSKKKQQLHLEIIEAERSGDKKLTEKLLEALNNLHII